MLFNNFGHVLAIHGLYSSSHRKDHHEQTETTKKQNHTHKQRQFIMIRPKAATQAKNMHTQKTTQKKMAAHVKTKTTNKHQPANQGISKHKTAKLECKRARQKCSGARKLLNNMKITEHETSIKTQQFNGKHKPNPGIVAATCQSEACSGTSTSNAWQGTVDTCHTLCLQDSRTPRNS